MNLKPISRCAFVSRPFECRWTESDTTLEPACSSRPPSRIEEVGVAADLVHRPGRAVVVDHRLIARRGRRRRARACSRSCGGTRSGRRPSRGRRRLGVDVVDFLDLERRDVAIFGRARSARAAISPHQSGAFALHRRCRAVLTTRSGVPIVHGAVVRRTCFGGGMSAGLPRGAPLSAHFAIFAISLVAQRRIVLVTSGCRCSSRRTRAASRRPSGRCRCAVLMARAQGRTSS